MSSGTVLTKRSIRLVEFSLLLLLWFVWVAADPVHIETEGVLIGPEIPVQHVGPAFLDTNVWLSEAERLLPPHLVINDVLWAARTAYSESNRLKEQELVLWVIRNRYEVRYRRASSPCPSGVEWRYKCVITHYKQFSAFLPSAPRRAYYVSKAWDDPNPAWQATLVLAFKVLTAPNADNPLPNVLHFFSPTSMKPRGTEPLWASRLEPVLRIPGKDYERFVFLTQ